MKNSKEEKDSNPRITLIVMTRWPAVGRCKKRLAQEIGSKSAASIQKKLIRHTISVAKQLEEKNLIEIRLAVCGVAFRAAKRWGARNGIKKVFLQGEGCLGLRMKRQVMHAQQSRQNTNHRKSTIVIGTDLPSLSQIDLIKAIEALKKHEIVLGPALDGGYWLIGFSGKSLDPIVNWPFSGIPWGTNQVLKQTLISANLKKANYKLLHLQNDIDQSEDLLPWQG